MKKQNNDENKKPSEMEAFLMGKTYLTKDELEIWERNRDMFLAQHLKRKIREVNTFISDFQLPFSFVAAPDTQHPEWERYQKYFGTKSD